MIFDVQQKTIEDIKSLELIDHLIVSIGYEQRASHLATILNEKDIKIGKKYCFTLVENNENSEYFKLEDYGFNFYKTDDLEYILKDLKGVIVVDYSVMMKSLYARILKLLANSDNQYSNVYFSYTNSLFESYIDINSPAITNKQILLTEDKILDRYKKRKLLISLGYERLSAIGIIEELEFNYEDIYVFINNHNKKYYLECKQQNKILLSNLGKNQIMEFDFFNFNQTVTILDSILNNLESKDCQVILAPMSVKTFSLLSMIHSLNYSNVILYNTSSRNSDQGKKYSKKADFDKKPLVYKISKNDNKSTLII
ncbi:hypothetical protein [Aquimarina sp. Aq107]|uniref:hypothetical protein n=1 Tax=Aquimarina sp. Aq107 TaxID=1191912 RepID=UPI000D553B41|nr:hypothetical protein [Aquimarina sp. Aq107]